jgi:hypothetical protein
VTKINSLPDTRYIEESNMKDILLRMLWIDPSSLDKKAKTFDLKKDEKSNYSLDIEKIKCSERFSMVL